MNEQAQYLKKIDFFDVGIIYSLRPWNDSLQSQKMQLRYMPNPIMSLNQNKHRANCQVPLGECGECVRLLGFPLLAEKLENFDKGYHGGQ
jgi:hypothetical protein